VQITRDCVLFGFILQNRCDCQCNIGGRENKTKQECCRSDWPIANYTVSRHVSCCFKIVLKINVDNIIYDMTLLTYISSLLYLIRNSSNKMLSSSLANVAKSCTLPGLGRSMFTS
jgi:hypothetical protein